MIIEQTVEIPDSRRVQFSPEVPVGRFRIVFFPDPPVGPKTGLHEELPKGAVTGTEIRRTVDLAGADFEDCVQFVRMEE
jgi:hypothetical protein